MRGNGNRHIYCALCRRRVQPDEPRIRFVEGDCSSDRSGRILGSLHTQCYDQVARVLVSFRKQADGVKA